MDKSSKYFKPIKTTILVGISLLYLIFIIIQIFSLTNNSYLINESNLYKLDSIKLMDKVYLTGGGRGSSEHYEFEDTNGFAFIIDGKEYSSITNNSFVYDTLQYSSTFLTIYTDKDGYENYLQGNKSTNIEVYQFSIGDKKCIDINKLNSDIKKVKTENLIFLSIAYVLLFTYFYRLKKFE
jgi:hypothetical protein